MKKNKLILLLLPFTGMIAAAQKDSVPPPKEIVKLKYFNDNNAVQYLILENSVKTGKKIEPLKDKTFQLYLDANKAENLVGKVTTDKEGRAKSFIPPGLKANWDAVPVHTFIASAAGKEDESAVELEITKAKIKIDTSSADGSKNITVQVMKYDKDAWVPASEVEMKIGIRRLGGILSAGDQDTYTTDSTGTVSAQFNKDSLPGDANGNIVLVARVDDNDLYGNMYVEKAVPWGVGVKMDNTFFDQRTLWSTRFHTPLWLLFMAYSIVLVVWGTIVYLVMQIIKIKKMGVEEQT